MPNRTSLLIRGRSRRCVPLRVPLGGLQTRCTVQQSLSLEEEEQTLCMSPRPLHLISALTPMRCAQDLTIRTWTNTTVIRT